VKSLCLLLATVSLSGCFIGDEDSDWASREQIVAAAKRCGLADFEPTPAGGGWAAYAPGEDPDHGPKTNCIYADLRAHGLKATRMPRGAALPILVAAAALVAGCAKAPAPPRDVRGPRLVELEAMGRKCGYPRSGWELVGTEDLHLRPDPNERYQVVDCMLGEIKKSDIPFKMGFVGNEAYEPGNGQ
jgi:hypothetical protein